MSPQQLLAIFIGITASVSVSAATVEITIQAVPTEDGILYAQLCNKEQFLAKRCSFLARAMPKRGEVTMTIADVPDGEWAVNAFLDENKNGRLDTNFLGIPTEPWGFSRNAKAMFGPPTFEDSKLNIKGDTRIVFRLN